jgi:hypothetical protein
MRGRAGLLLVVLAASARAAQAAVIPADLELVTPREAFLAAALGAMMAVALASFFLAGRVSERTHVALAILVVLIGAFPLLILFGSLGRSYPIAGAFVVLGLIGLFKLMNQFEIRRKPAASANRPDAAGRTKPSP